MARAAAEMDPDSSTSSSSRILPGPTALVGDRSMRITTFGMSGHNIPSAASAMAPSRLFLRAGMSPACKALSFDRSSYLVHVRAGLLMQFLTTAEAAEYLRLKERKLYELVANGALPCTKATGRWLFPKSELDRWLAAGLVRPQGMPPAEPMPIVGGSHDPLLEWALLESHSGPALLAEGSGSGFERFAKGEIAAAAVHLHRLDGDAADANVEAVKARRELHDAVLIGFARREQGLLLAAGNPLKIASLADVIAKRARIA